MLRGVVAPPVPYRMRVEVDILRVSPPVEVEAAVHGDLEGRARLSVHPAGTGWTESTIDIGWEVEMMQRPMRIACRFGYPLLKWGHDRVIEMTVSSFRRHVESEWRAGILRSVLRQQGRQPARRLTRTSPRALAREAGSRIGRLSL